MTDALLLIDLSSLVHPLFHLSSREPDPDWTSTTALGKARALASRYTRTAICCDRGRSFRKDISPEYKGNRPEKQEALIHQLRVTIEALERDGFPIWGVDTYEADDIIATAARMAVERGLRVVIASSDKDLLQLVDDAAGISALSLRDHTVYDEAGVVAKFGVQPGQMLTYLALTGDSADNIKGVKGIGPKNAVKLIQQVVAGEPLTSLLTGEQLAQYGAAAQLVILNPNAPINFDQVLADRQPDNTPIEDRMTDTLSVEPVTIAAEVVRPTAPHTPVSLNPPAVMAPGNIVPMPTPALSFSSALEPRNVEDARTVAKWLHASRLFSAYGQPEAVFAVVMAGREMGLGATASLRAFHIVEGRPTLAADFIRALVLNSGKMEYFRCTERTATKATWEAKRKGDPEPTTLTYTIEEAQTAGLVKPNSGWTKHPADMLSKTASTKLARLVAPDVTFGLYATEELEVA